MQAEIMLYVNYILNVFVQRKHEPIGHLGRTGEHLSAADPNS
jgi:hypothetical protein